MKRKLSISFENNRILNISLFERGKRKELKSLASSQEAIKEVSSLLSVALTACAPTSQEVEEIDLMAETGQTTTVATANPAENLQNLSEVVQSLPYSVCARAKNTAEAKGSDD